MAQDMGNLDGTEVSSSPTPISNQVVVTSAPVTQPLASQLSPAVLQAALQSALDNLLQQSPSGGVVLSPVEVPVVSSAVLASTSSSCGTVASSSSESTGFLIVACILGTGSCRNDGEGSTMTVEHHTNLSLVFLVFLQGPR